MGCYLSAQKNTQAKYAGAIRSWWSPTAGACSTRLIIETRNVAVGFGRHGMPPPASNDTGTALGHDGSDWSCGLATLTFDFGVHGACGWCGSSSYAKFEFCRPCHSENYCARCVWALMGLVTLTFDLLTLKLVCESHLRCGTSLPNLGTLGLWVRKLFAMYATDGRTDKNNA